MEAAGRPHFGGLLRQFRLDAGMTQQELAERAKLSVEAISTLERGARTRPYRETVVLLGRALELSPERLALLESAIGVAHPSRQRERSEALSASLLRLVRPDAQVDPRHNLPHQLTSFVGRQREVNEIATHLREHRLVTIVGAGGVGKTRVAVQLGGNLLEGYPDGVWLVDLAPLADQTLVGSAVLSALQLAPTTGSSLDVVVAYLKKHRLLLILDNCEHVLPPARDAAANIIQSCPQVRLLATSRQPLTVPGERIYRLPSLGVPPDSCRTSPDALRYGAVALFVDRALAVEPGFALTDDNAPDVAEISRRLDGIPLAIELAAARVRVLAPRQIVERLDQRFRLLTGGDPRALPRHQTMTALVDWSYDLLAPREQRFFESLSVFAGGCTLDAVTAICATDDEDDVGVIDLIESLVTKSLLLAELAGSEQRYRLLESSRQYAREKLISRGEQRELARRHALFYVELAERLRCEWETIPEREWLRQANIELENWRTALEWTLAQRGDVILGQRLASVRGIMWRSFPLAESRRWVRTAIELIDERTPPRLIAQLEHSQADRARRFGEFKVALAAAERALSRYRELGSVSEIAQTQSLAGAMLSVLGRPSEAEALLGEALEGARAMGDRRLTATVLFQLGFANTATNDFLTARTYLADALRLAKLLDSTLLEASIGVALAQNEYLAGDPAAALSLIDEVLANDPSRNSAETGIAWALADKSTYLIALGRYDEARTNAKETLECALGLQLTFVIVRSLQHLAVVTLLPQVEDLGPVEYAGVARLFGFVEARLTSLGALEDLEHQHYHRALTMLRDAIGAEEVAKLMAAGATTTEDEAIAQAHSLK